VGIVGWYVAHGLAMRRDRAAKRRELRVQFLVDAYRRLESVSNRPFRAETGKVLESAIADIQLFGTPNQVRLAQEFAAGYARNHTHPIKQLLTDLRNDLRRELGLPATPEPPRALRIELPKESTRPDGNDA